MSDALDDAALLQRIDSAIADGGRLPLFGRWQSRQGDQVSATLLHSRTASPTPMSRSRSRTAIEQKWREDDQPGNRIPTPWRRSEMLPR